MVIEHIPPLRATWAGRKIIHRIPHVQPGEAYLTLTQRNVPLVPPATAALPIQGEKVQGAYVHAQEIPFEIQDMVLDTTLAVRVSTTDFVATPVVSQSTYIDQQNLVDASAFINAMRDAERGENFLRSPHRLAAAFNPETGIWQLDDPYVVINGRGVVIYLTGSGRSLTVADTTFDRLRVAITLRGELLVLGDRVEEDEHGD